MATVFNNPNAQVTQQVQTLTVTAAGVGGTLTATINTKTVVYTAVTGDTTTSAATNWAALLAASTIPELAELTYSSTNNVITVTGPDTGAPFTLSAVGAGGATVSSSVTVTASSPSDVSLAANWLRAGVAALPQNGDDVIIANSTVPLLYNLDALAAIQFASFTRWQSQTGQIGLPFVNPAGYIEYRPTYFQFSASGTLPILLGYGAGSGPPLEHYNVGAVNTALTVLASGSATEDTTIHLLTTGATTTVSLVNTSLSIATRPGEVSSIASANVGAGGTLNLGVGVTVTGAITYSAAQGTLACAPGAAAALNVYNGSSVIVQSSSLTYFAVNGKTGSTITWNSNSTITTLDLTASSTLSKAADKQAMTITNSAMDGDTCQIPDPFNAITYTNATSVRNLINLGPFQIGPGRSVKIT